MTRVALLSREPGQYINHMLFRAVGNELKEGSIRIAEVHALSLSACSGSFHRTEFQRDAVLLKVMDRVRDPAVPFEAEITAAGHHGQPCPRRPNLFRSVGVELNRSEPEHCSQAVGHDFGPEYIPVKGNRAFLVADVNDAMVEADSGH